MNNSFSWQRTLLFARKHYAENIRNYLYGILALIAAIIALRFFFNNAGSAPTFIAMFGAAVYFAQISCSSYFSRSSIEQSYSLPATTFEKYLFLWVNSVIVSSIVILGISALIALLFVSATGKTFAADIKELDLILWLWFFGIQAAALFTCCWVKGSPLKGYLLVAGIYFAFIFGYMILWRKFSMASGNFFFDSVTCMIGMQYPEDSGAGLVYRLNSPYPSPLSDVIYGIWIPVFWLAGYFKFKERTLK